MRRAQAVFIGVLVLWGVVAIWWFSTPPLPLINDESQVFLPPTTTSAFTQSADRVPSLALTGVLNGDHTRYALLLVGESHEGSYREGESITPSIRLITIGTTDVIVDVNGKKQKLALHNTRTNVNTHDQNNFEKQTENNFSKKMEHYLNGRPLVAVRYPQGAHAEGVSMLGDEYYALVRNKVAAQISHPEFLKQAKFNFSDSGLYFSEIVPGSLYDQAGIAVGDTITHINDQAINSSTDVQQWLGFLQQDKQMMLKIKRGNNTHILYYKFL